MKARCNNKNNPNYHNYGGRGIQVCERWKAFENFYEDMGDPPFKGANLDRINNDGNYEPSNCRWVTKKENQRNKRQNLNVNYEGQIFCLSEACEKAGISHGAVRSRIRRYKMTPQQAFDFSLIHTPSKNGPRRVMPKLTKEFIEKSKQN
jgi:hypothetical protein